MKNDEQEMHCVTISSASEEIVISGMSGRFPECDSVQEFMNNLFAGVDLVTSDDRRWPQGTHGLPSRAGKLNDMTRFDAQFFGVHPKQARVMDPQVRILLELTHEAILDAGLNPAELRGTRTGVYVGVGSNESAEFWSQDPDHVNGYGMTGTCRSMFANRLSYSFDFKGPSFAVDTACSSSLLALHQAVLAMRSGECDSAVVAGCHAMFNPGLSLQLHRLNMLSLEGKCKTFDASAGGYVRSEAAVVIFLQRASSARRVYASVLGTGCNNDGHKPEGITYPSGATQRRLAEQVCAEAGVDPASVAYFEAHGTGTKVGDPEEVNNVAEVFCKGRSSPLLIGSVKSNVGHAEAAAGLVSITKVLLSMERGEIPGNLHFAKPNEDIPALIDGRMQVVDRNWPWDGGLAALNNFGFGGLNTNVILKSSSMHKKESTQLTQAIPRVITVSGRTKEAVEYFLNEAEKISDVEFHALLADIHKINVNGHTFRGYALQGQEGDVREVQECNEDKRPMWWVFSGMGTQWPSMAKSMMGLPPFAKAIRTCAQALEPHGVNLLDIVANSSEETFKNNALHSFVCIAAVQVALVDTLQELGLQPDGILGHSAGELGCAYADGTFSAEQTVLAAYWRGLSLAECQMEPGRMAAVGLSWDEVASRCPPDVCPACHNSADSVTVSGPANSISEFVKKLQDEGIFAKEVESAGVAFHSKYVLPAEPGLRRRLEELLPAPKPRSSRWLSTSIPEKDWGTPLAQLSSADYHVNNLLSPVLFAEALEKVPDNAVVVEIAPHHLLQAVIKRAKGKGVSSVGLMRRGHEDCLSFFFASIGKLYIAGAQPHVGRLQPPIQYPVARSTPMISHMIKWDHSTEWDVPDYSSTGKHSGESVIDVDVSQDSDSYLAGHCLDRRILFPASGYANIVWRTFAKIHGKSIEEFPVVFEDIRFLRVTVLHPRGGVKFFVTIMEGSGRFEVCESGSVVVTGRICSPVNIDEEFTKPVLVKEPGISSIRLTSLEVYRELSLRGYDYSGAFKGILWSDSCSSEGSIQWADNWVSFIELMMQFTVLGNPSRGLSLLESVEKIVVDPKRHRQIVEGLPADAGVPITFYKDQGVVKAGGIEIWSARAFEAPQKLDTQNAPRITKHTFVPYINNEPHAKDHPALARRTALTVVLQVALENLSAERIQVVELMDDRPVEALLAPSLIHIIENEPSMYVDMTVVSVAVDSLPPELGAKLSRVDATAGLVDTTTSVHVLVAADMACRIASHASLWQNLVGSVASGGFVLLEEPADVSDVEVARTGLALVAKQCAEGRAFLLFRKEREEASATAAQPTVVKVTGTSSFQWLEPLKAAVRQNVSAPAPGRVILLSQSEEGHSGVLGLASSLRLEPGGKDVRAVLVQDPQAPSFNLDAPLYARQLALDLRTSVLRSGGVWGSYRHLPVDSAPSASKQVEHAYMNPLKRGGLSSLSWIEGPLPIHRQEGRRETELCSVYYASLNLRDSLLVAGDLSPESLPGYVAGQTGILGQEFSGRDSTGRRVMGMVSGRSLATSVLADTTFLWEVPTKWTLEQAASVPVCYSTSYYALLVRGRLRGGESVLVQAAAGGAGQAALAIALHLGCTVYATVENPSQRHFLKNVFPEIPDAHIVNLDGFQHDVLSRTRGRGVDVVLSGLAGERMLRASLRCVAPHGRLLQLGDDSPHGLGVVLRSVSFHSVDLDALFQSAEEAGGRGEREEVARLVSEGIASGAVRPLQVAAFCEKDAKQAFRFLASGQHVCTKVVLQIRPEEADEKATATPKMVAAVPVTYLSPEKVYVVVGGLGGFGLELSHWLVQRGARRLLLVSRSGLRTGYQAAMLHRWHATGVSVRVAVKDCSTRSGARELLAEARGLGPVGGIFNTAVSSTDRECQQSSLRPEVLRDANLLSLSESDFSAVCAPKIQCASALDEASRSLCPQLDYFVCFSSITTAIGLAGQTGYGLANSAMERLCEARQEAGLPALAVQWGAIGDVGLATESMAGLDSSTEVNGTLPQRMASCLATLDWLLQQHRQPVLSSILLPSKQRSATTDSSVSASQAVANVLGIRDITTVYPSQTLSDLGMDSIMGAEVQQMLKRNYNIILSPTEIRNLTLTKLATMAAAG